MKYKYLLLDWDGCLAKTLDVWMKVYLDVYAEHGIKTNEASIIQKSWGNLADGPRNFCLKDPDSVWKTIVKQVRENVKSVDLYDGVKDTLVELKQAGHKLAIVTSSEKSIVEPALAHHDLDQMLDAVVTEDDVQKPKPDPQMLEIALEKIGGDKNQSMIVGDTGKDIQAGKNLGIATTLVLHPTNSRFYDFTTLKKLEADHEIKKINQLVDLLKN